MAISNTAEPPTAMARAAFRKLLEKAGRSGGSVGTGGISGCAWYGRNKTRVLQAGQIRGDSNCWAGALNFRPHSGQYRTTFSISLLLIGKRSIKGGGSEVLVVYLLGYSRGTVERMSADIGDTAQLIGGADVSPSVKGTAAFPKSGRW